MMSEGHYQPDYQVFYVLPLCSMIGFFTLYSILEHVYYSKSGSKAEQSKYWKEFAKLSATQKADYLSRIISQVHAAFAVVFSIYGIFFEWYDNLFKIL